MALNGSTVLLFVYDKDYAGTTYTDKYIPLAEQTGLSQEESMNLIESSNKSDAHTAFIYGRADTTLSVDANYASNPSADEKGFLVLQNAKKNRKKAYVKRAIFDGTNFTDVEYAEVLVSKISKEFPNDDSSTLSIDLQVNGGFQSAAPTINDDDVSGSTTP